MNSLANLTVFTLKKGYARNVCDFSQFDTFAYFYAISTFCTFYFLLSKTPVEFAVGLLFLFLKCIQTRRRYDCHRSANGQGKKKFFKVREKLGDFILSQRK